MGTYTINFCLDQPERNKICTKAKDYLRSHCPNIYTVDTGKFYWCGSSCTRCSCSNQMGKLYISRDDFQNLNRVQWHASVSVPAELSNGHYWFLPVLWHVLVMVGLMVSKTLGTNPLFFYRSQNVLCLFKNFCAGTKLNFTECKSSFCLT